ncbi:MAG: hypothetical protein MUE73_01060 [Planctomycetes bacterium]|nr:hypothetical protein [Planctomycetota bacterium]
MTPRTALLLCLALLVPVAPAHAYPAEDAREIASPSALARADHDAILDAMAGIIERDPESPLLPAALLRIHDSRQFAVSEDGVTNRLLAVIERGVRSGENDEGLRRYVSERLRERGEIDRAEALAPDRGHALHWVVGGPFGIEVPSGIDRRFGPDESLDFARPYREAGRDLRFLPLPLDDDRTIEPFDVLPEGRGVFFAVAQVRSDAARPALLRVVSGGTLRVFVNGVEALRMDRRRERRPSTRFAPAVLRPGLNRIVVKGVGTGAQFSLKIVDPDRLAPLPGLAEEDSPVLREVGPAPAALAPPPIPADPLAGDHTPHGLAVRGILLLDEGLDIEAVTLFERAAREAAEDPGLHYLLGTYVDPDFGPAIIALAALDHGDDRSEQAVAALRARLAKVPGDLEARWLLCRVAADREWEKEALDAASACLETAPRFRDARFFLAQHFEHYGNTTLRRKHLEAALAARANDWAALRRIAELDAVRGDLDSAIARLERISAFWPRHAGNRIELAGLLADRGRTGEALAALGAIAAAYPHGPWHPRRIGDLLLRSGDLAGTVEHWRRSLVVDPSQADLRRAIDRLEGVDSDFARPFETDVFGLIRKAPGREEHPRSPAICLLDQTIQRVWPDGSSSSVVHMVHKLLDEKGVEAFGRVETPGETLEVRTIDPSGRVFEPVGVSRNSFNMPALAPGAVVDYRYRADSPSAGREFTTHRFFFGDPDFENAVLLSRWVVILPKDFECELVLRNFAGRHEVSTDGDTIVHRFEVENSPRVEVEPFMPPAEDLLPSAQFVRHPPLDDVASELSGSFWNGLAPTPPLRAAAGERTRDISTDLEKARALHAFVNGHVTGDGGPGSPTATLIEKSGDRFSLLASLLLAADVPFEPGMACPDRGRHVHDDAPEAGRFQRRALRIHGGDSGSTWVFDGPRFAPFGRIPDDCRDSPVMLLGPSGGRIESLPPAPDEDCENISTARVRLTADRSATSAEFTLEIREEAGYEWKEQLRRTDADGRRRTLEGIVSMVFPGATVESHDLPDLLTPGQPAILAANASLPTFLAADGPGASCDLGLRPLRLAQEYVGKPERIHPMVIDTDDGQVDRVEIDLGGAWRVASLPSDHVTIGPLGYYSLTVEMTPAGTLAVTRRTRFRPVRLEKDEYPALVNWVKAIDEAETRKIRLLPREDH